MEIRDYLGMNLRNQKYIDWDKTRTNFTNSKLKTKLFLSARQIRVPKLHAIIKNHKDLQNLDYANLPAKTVIKPNKGSQGKGIIPFQKKVNGNFVSVSNKTYKHEVLHKHIQEILDGKYSMGFIPDTAFFEEKIDTHNALREYAPIGLPDIRIIVYKGFPVLAMLRMPNEKSGGKANLNAGAWGLGIDIVSGKVKTCYQDGKLQKNNPYLNFQVPFYNEALQMAVKIAEITNISFFGCDIAISKNGPVLIELNSKPGLKIQLVNNVGLKYRLEKVDGLKVRSKQDKVFIVSQLFNTDKQDKNNKSDKIIDINQRASILANHKKISASLEISTKHKNTYVSKDIFEELHVKENSKIKIKIGNISEVLKLKLKEDLPDQTISLGSKFLGSYQVNFVSKNKKVQLPKATKTEATSVYIKPSINYGEVDYKINQIAKSLKLVEKLKPKNLKVELDTLNKDHNYNPQFEYENHLEMVYQKQNDLLNIHCDDSVLGRVYEDKKTELFNILNIIQNIGNPELQYFYSKYIPAPTESEFKLAKKLKSESIIKKEKPIEFTQIIKQLEQTLRDYDLKNWRIQIKNDMIGKFSVNKSNKIFVKKDISITQTRLDKIIAHEILTHVLTTQNGKKQPYLIFQDGMARYLETQEGMAIYNEYELNDLPGRTYAARNLISSYMSLKYGFAESINKLVDLGFKRTIAQRHVLRTKRGLSDTSKPGGITKQVIYTRGALKIEKFIKKGGDIRDLYIGKIDVDKIDEIKKMNFINYNIILPKKYR
jgi:alpha-L-glutamate ligase-like protein